MKEDERTADQVRKDIHSVLLEILTWTRVTSYPQVKQTLSEQFPITRKDGSQNEEASKDAIIYSLADGERSQKEIGEWVGLSQPPISSRFKKWEKLGLLKDSKALFDLVDFDIKVIIPSKPKKKDEGK